MNGGAEYTNSPRVTLTLSAKDPESPVETTHLKNRGDSQWRDFKFVESMSWSLSSSGSPTKTVDVKFTNKAGLTSQPYSTSIKLKTTT